MPTIIQTNKVDFSSLHEDDILQVYNGLDCCLTIEILEKLLASPMRSKETDTIYTFERALLRPALSMTIRGIKVDKDFVFQRQRELVQLRETMQHILDSITEALYDDKLNVDSHDQVKELLYNLLRIPKQYSFTSGKRTPTSDRPALEKLIQYRRARPIINCLLSIKDINSELRILDKRYSSDWRMRSTFKVAGTESGRWSASKDAFKEGDNAQNKAEKTRKIFVADPGYKMCYNDLEQAESRAVGALIWECSGDPTYLDACESGDLHTAVCQMIWPDLGWTDNPYTNKHEIAAQKFYRDFSRRDMAKKCGHLTNYDGSPYALSASVKVPLNVAEDFQHKYFQAFKGMTIWHQKTTQQLQTKGIITTPFGRRRQFFGHLAADKTRKEAIAYVPQSMVADIMNLGILRVWENLRKDVQVLLQVHDALGAQYLTEKEDHILPLIKKYMEVPFTIANRIVTIPVELTSGWNWGKYKEDKNPDGLKEYKSHDTRQRQYTPALSMLR